MTKKQKIGIITGSTIGSLAIINATIFPVVLPIVLNNNIESDNTDNGIQSNISLIINNDDINTLKTTMSSWMKSTVSNFQAYFQNLQSNSSIQLMNEEGVNWIKTIFKNTFDKNFDALKEVSIQFNGISNKDTGVFKSGFYCATVKLVLNPNYDFKNCSFDYVSVSGVNNNTLTISNIPIGQAWTIVPNSQLNNIQKSLNNNKDVWTVINKLGEANDSKVTEILNSQKVYELFWNLTSSNNLDFEKYFNSLKGSFSSQTNYATNNDAWVGTFTFFLNQITTNNLQIIFENNLTNLSGPSITYDKGIGNSSSTDFAYSTLINLNNNEYSLEMCRLLKSINYDNATIAEQALNLCNGAVTDYLIHKNNIYQNYHFDGKIGNTCAYYDNPNKIRQIINKGFSDLLPLINNDTNNIEKIYFYQIEISQSSGNKKFCDIAIKFKSSFVTTITFGNLSSYVDTMGTNLTVTPEFISNFTIQNSLPSSFLKFKLVK